MTTWPASMSWQQVVEHALAELLAIEARRASLAEREAGLETENEGHDQLPRLVVPPA